jgi:dihydrofolate reductase
MSKVRSNIAISLDGYVAGPNQTMDNPLGEGGEQLHEWVFPLAIFREAHGMGDGGEVNASTTVVEENLANLGAGIMGRNMFGGGPGAWNTADPWLGWWGEDPPFHHPVFVLTHHPREPLTLSDTTFTFVTGGPESAIAQARKAAGDKDITIHGGGAAVRQYLAAGLLDELQLNVTPIILGGGERLLDNIPNLKLEQIRAIEAPGVTHLKYRVVK